MDGKRVQGWDLEIGKRIRVYNYQLGEIFDKCPIAENRFTSCLLLII